MTGITSQSRLILPGFLPEDIGCYFLYSEVNWLGRYTRHLLFPLGLMVGVILLIRYYDPAFDSRDILIFSIILFGPYCFVLVTYLTHDIRWKVRLSPGVVEVNTGKNVLQIESNDVKRVLIIENQFWKRFFPYDLYYIRLETKDGHFLHLSCLAVDADQLSNKLNVPLDRAERFWPTIP